MSDMKNLKDSRKQAQDHLKRIAQAGIIAAMYIALTFVFAPISFGAIQVRIAEALTILPIFTPAAIPGLFVGCLLGNILGGAVIWDVIFGSLATLLGAIGTYLLRKRNPIFGTIPPIISNTVIIPFVLRYAYGMEDTAHIILMFSIFCGEVLSCGVLGGALGFALRKAKGIFPEENKKADKNEKTSEEIINEKDNNEGKTSEENANE